MPSFVNGFGKTSFIPVTNLAIIQKHYYEEQTVSEIHINVVCPYVRSHRDNRNRWPYFSNANSSRHAIEVGHDNVHKNKIKLVRTVVNLVHSFESVPLFMLVKEMTIS